MHPRPAAETIRRGSNLPRVGDYNQVVVLEAIRRHPEGLSRVELAELTGLSAQAMSNICRRLLTEGLVEEAGKQGGGPGKPRTLLRLASTGRYAVGVHLDPALVTVVVLDLVGNVVARHDLPLRRRRSADAVLAEVAREVETLVATSGVDRERIVGLGVAAPGPVDAATGSLVHPPNLPGWERVRVRDVLAAATGLPVVLDKDVIAAAVAELWSGGVGGTGSAVFVYLGTGIGAGLVLRGEVFRGASGNAGSIGDLISGTDGLRLGEVCAPAAVVAEAERRGLGSWGGDPTALQAVAALSEGGSAPARELLEDQARHVAKSVVDLVDLLDVEQVVFGGPLWSRLSPTFLAVVPPVVRREAVAAGIHAVQVRGTRVGVDVAAVGAACLVLEDAFGPRAATLLVGH
ncbi:ROK family transcriptional regulator [Kineococcus gynurae]|uniref:ROK family transcriptional regulator n=1 Tax=Kineococcus gynurae TaxID=452979 RepID=A0ABV5LNF4_9ACTN